MGKVITKKTQGMSWLTKTGLVLLLTLTASAVISNGWFRPSQASAAIARVQTTTGGNATATTSIVMTALGTAPVNGNTLVATISTRAATANQVSSITQTGAVWSRVASSTGTAGTTTEIWYAPNVTGAATAITINLATAAQAAAVVAEYSGILTASAVDVSNTATGNSAAAVTGTTATTTRADELWLGAIGLVSSGFTLTAPLNSFTSVTLASSTNGTATNNARVYLLERIATATGAASSGGTVSTSSQWSGAIATFRMALGSAAITNCGGCHGYPGGTNTTYDGATRANGLFPGTHNTHVTTYSYTCNQCHRAPTTTTSADFNHSDGKIRMTNPINGNLNARYGNVTSWQMTRTPSFNTCNTTNCHGQLSPAWASTASSTQCTKCHGQANAVYLTNYTSAVIAPGGAGRDTGGKTLATDARVGAHQTHMVGGTVISRTIRCIECHASVTPATLAAHLNRTTATIAFGPIAQSNSHTTAATTRTGGIITCNNTYCHTGKLNTGAAMTPTWNATGYLSGSMTVNDCKQCHGMPPTPGAGAHATVSALAAFPATTCGCHANLSSTGSTYANVFVNKAIHVDGTIDVSACDSCHGFPPTSGAHTKHINKLLVLKGLGAIPAGFTSNLVCGACHNDSSTTMHKGDNALATTRNIYAPTATAYQLTFQFGANPPSYDKAGTTTCSNISCHLGESTAWGATVVSCNNCHGYPPVTTVADPDNKHAGTLPVNHIGVGSSVNTKATFVSQHGGCRICHGTQDTGTGTHSPHVNYDPLTQHATGSINMNGPVGAAASNSTQYDSTNRGCNAACHANDASHRMTASSLTLAYGSYGPGGDCVSCHLITQGTRSAVSTEFGLAWGHKKSARGAVLKSDCIVCHLEGDFTTQGVDGTYHLGVPGGNVDLRDPDGAGKTAITNISGAAFTFTKFAVSYAAGSRTTNGHLSNTNVANVVTQKFCLACHDSNGATNTTARTRNATNTATTGTQYMPFGGVNLGATYTLTNGAAAAGGVVDVKKQFASTNSSKHPIMAPLNKDYPTPARLLAPYNNFVRAGTSGTRTLGIVMNCFDCHNNPTLLTTRTNIAHGAATQFRGTYYVATPTLCTACHGGTLQYTQASAHGAGSALTTGASNMSATTYASCHNCHFSNTALPARPIPGFDIHGFNGLLTTGGAWGYGNGSAIRPISFIRNTVRFTTVSPRPMVSTSASIGILATGNATCGGSSPTGCGDNMSRYQPGGSY